MELSKKMNVLELVNTMAWASQDLLELDLQDLKGISGAVKNGPIERTIPPIGLLLKPLLRPANFIFLREAFGFSMEFSLLLLLPPSLILLASVLNCYRREATNTQSEEMPMMWVMRSDWGVNLFSVIFRFITTNDLGTRTIPH